MIRPLTRAQKAGRRPVYRGLARQGPRANRDRQGAGTRPPTEWTLSLAPDRTAFSKKAYQFSRRSKCLRPNHLHHSRPPRIWS